MTCQELRESFEFYALGTLGMDRGAVENQHELADGNIASEIEAHLARGCDNCRQALADAVAINAGIMSLIDLQAPPARVKRRVMASIGVEKPGWGWVWALAAASLLTLSLWLGVQERDRSAELADARKTLVDVQGQRDQLAQAMLFLSDPQTVPASFGRGATAPPRGYVFLHQKLGVLLVASNLPAAGEGKTYEMWVIPKGGAPRPAGLFQSSSTTAMHILSGPVDTSILGAVAVTLEPAAGSAAPTTTPIIVASLT